MKPYYSDDQVILYLGDCLDILPTLPDASIDAVVTDPPYEIGFMGKKWDASGIAYNADVWRQCWRVLKPGGHLVAFGGTRTYHRMTVAIEDAGFEIRDSLHWIYGSGFPKGQDIAKSIDKHRDDRDETLQVTAWLAAQTHAAGWDRARLNALFGFHARGIAAHWITQSVAARVPSPEQWDRLKQEIGFDDTEILPLVAELNARRGTLGDAWLQREVIGRRHSGLGNGATSIFLSGTTGRAEDGTIPVTAPASDGACRWQGWNTALKPAHEPIVLARKSTGFNTTVANVLEHGTGALNIDGCRTNNPGPHAQRGRKAFGGFSESREVYGAGLNAQKSPENPAGRWPTNILLGHGPDCADRGECQPGCPVAEINQQSGVSLSAGGSRGQGGGRGAYSVIGAQPDVQPGYGDTGGASRFFPVFRYEAKASASERPRLEDGRAHATVKPLALMRWLVRLVTPPGGTVLDPFVGSGTTLEACVIEGFHATGIELDAAHAALCKTRLGKPIEPVLFGDLDTA